MTGPLSCVMSVVEKDGKILLIRRSKEPFKDCWSFPGGKIESAEHPDDAILREIREETGFECEIKELLGSMSEHVVEEGKLLWHLNTFVFHLSPVRDGDIETPEGELKWFNLKDMPLIKETITPSDYRILQELFLGGKRGHFKCVIERRKGTYEPVLFEFF